MTETKALLRLPDVSRGGSPTLRTSDPKLVSILLACLLLIATSSGAAQASKKKPKRVKREIEETYQGPALVANAPGAGFTAVCLGGAPNGCFESYELDPQMDRFASVDIQDQLGLSVHGYLVACGTRTCDSDVTIVADFCTKTGGPIDLDRSLGMSLYISAQPCASGAPSMVTQGTVKITLSNLP